MALGSSGRRIVVEFIGDASALKKGVQDGEKSLQGFSGKAQAVGSIAGKALAGGLVLAGAAAVSFTKNAVEDDAAQRKLALALQNTTGATKDQVAGVEDWISKQGVALGVTDDDLRPAFQRLAQATGSITKAQRLASIAMDASAATGKDLKTVTEAMAKAQNGNLGALSRLGIKIKDTEGKTLSFNQVTKEMADTFKGQASAAANSTEGKFNRLQVQFDELKESIGYHLIPAAMKLAQVGLQIVDWMSKNTTTAGIFLGVLGSLLAITVAVGLATKVAGAFTTVWSAATKIAAAAQWLLNAALDANPIGLVVIALAALVGGLILAYKHSETFRNIVNAAFDACKTVVLGAIHAITAAVGAVIGFIKAHWSLLLGILTGPIGLAVVMIVKHWSQIKAATVNAWNAVKSTVGNQISSIVGFVRDIPGRIKSALSNLRTVLANLFDAAMTAGKNKVEDIGGSILGYLSSIPGKIKSAFAGIWNGLASGFKTAINAVLHLPLTIPRINTHIPGVGTVGGQTLIPALAKGGIVSKPTVALIGEAGPEAVVPLGRRGGHFAGTQITINVQSWDPKTAGQSVLAALRQVEQRTGRQLLVSPR